jgi:tRNA (guanine-N7-)-methyltransferase
MRTRNKPWADCELARNSKVVLNAEEYKGNWKKYFGNDNDIHLEIGCGKGRFITETSKLNTNINYIALEKNKSVLVVGAMKAEVLDCNIAFISGIVENLGNYFDALEISRVYINFCDPWENRKKWHKRRLTHSNFLSLYESIGVLELEVFLKTDNRELFEFSLNEFSKAMWRLKNITLDLHSSGYENIMTEYEKKFSEKGFPIYRCEASISKGR